MAEPSARIAAKVTMLFGDRAPEVATSLRELDFGLQSSDRVHAAVLILSGSEWNKLDEALRIARIDWRDVLVAAGLANGDWPQRVDAFLTSS